MNRTVSKLKSVIQTILSESYDRMNRYSWSFRYQKVMCSYFSRNQKDIFY